MMSISSGSDVTIPMQDSPPPPPSPYRNPKGLGVDPRSSTGIVNSGYQESSLNQNGGGGKKERHSPKSQTEIPMNDYKTTEEEEEGSRSPGSSPRVNEAVNSELVQGMSVLDTIPHKPQSEFGPYEKFPEYFISVNQHKKLFNRGEKLSVTKDKRKGSGKWKKYICWSLGGFLLAAIITVAVLAAVGLIPEKSSGGTYSMREMTTGHPDDLGIPSGSTESIFYSSSFPPQFSTEPPSTDSPSTTPTDNYVPNAADVELRLSDGDYEDELGNSSTPKFKEFAGEVEGQVKDKLEEEPDVDIGTARVTQFGSGSIIVKMRIGWSKIALGGEAPDFRMIQTRVSSWKTLGNFTVARGTVLDRVLNPCKKSNGGCSHNCAFDETALDLICTCPETQLLGADKRTCEEARTTPPIPSDPIVATSEASTEPEVSENPPSPQPIPEEPITTVGTTTSTTTTTPEPPVEEVTPGVSQEVPPPSAEPVTPEPQPLTPEATSPEVTGSTTTTTTEAPQVDTPAEEGEGRTESVREDPEDTTAIPELVHTSPTTPASHVTSGESQLTPEGSEEQPTGSGRGTNGMSSSVESVDANPLINMTTPTTVTSEEGRRTPEMTEEHRGTPEMSEEHRVTPEDPSEEIGVTILPLPSSETSSSGEQGSHARNKSSRSFTSNEETSSDEFTSPLPVSHSDEIMMYSDMRLANQNTSTSTTSRTLPPSHSEEVSVEESPEVLHGSNGEPRRSEQLVEGGAEVVPIEPDNGHPREVEEVTTTRPISLINDTLVNEMIENATEDGNSEPVLTEGGGGSVSQEGIVVEANSSNQSGETLTQGMNQSPESVESSGVGASVQQRPTSDEVVPTETVQQEAENELSS